MAKKTTAAEKTNRVRVVYELLLTDSPKSDIVRFSSEKWGVTERTTENYMAEATEIIKLEAEKYIEDGFAKNLQQRRHIKNKAFKAGDLRLVHEIVRDEAKLLNLYPAEKIDHSGQVETIVKVLKGVSVDDL